MRTYRNAKIVKCTGEAHSNAHIDNCGMCAPLWAIRALCPDCSEPLKLGKRRLVDRKRTYKGYCRNTACASYCTGSARPFWVDHDAEPEATPEPTPEPKEDPTPDFDEVMTLARRWHYREVRSIAGEAIKQLKGLTDRDTEEDCREWLDRWVHETCDGHSHVIYTANAQMLLAASDNADAYEEDMGEGTEATWSTKACYALMRDVWQLLDARSDEWIPEEPEEEVNTEPVIEEEDWITSDHVTFTRHGASTRNPRNVVRVPEGQDWRDVLAARMREEGFFPNVWFISDHGNAHLLSDVTVAPMDNAAHIRGRK